MRRLQVFLPCFKHIYDVFDFRTTSIYCGDFSEPKINVGLSSNSLRPDHSEYESNYMILLILRAEIVFQKFDHFREYFIFLKC